MHDSNTNCFSPPASERVAPPAVGAIARPWPELNPIEGVWRYLKQVELGTVCCDDLPELRGEIRLAVKRLRHKHRILHGVWPRPAARRPTPRSRPTADPPVPRPGRPLDQLYISTQGSAGSLKPHYS